MNTKVILNFNNFNEQYEHDIRKNYQKFGVEDFYLKVNNNYINPHLEYIKKSIIHVVKNYNLDFSNVLDLAAGTGEITTILKDLNINNVIGCEPYLYNEYIKNTNKKCLKYSFEDITKGILKDYKFSTIICSYALHLADKPIINDLLWNLSLISQNLVILSPNNNPIVNENNWDLIDYFKIDKCKTRIFSIKYL